VANYGHPSRVVHKEETMTRRVITVIVIVLLVAALAAAVGVLAYHAGHDQGLVRGEHRMMPGYGFPGYGYRFANGGRDGFFVVLLVLVILGLGATGVLIAAWRPRRPNPVADATAPQDDALMRERFEQWHRQLHESEATAFDEQSTTEPIPPADPAAASEGKQGRRGKKKEPKSAD
jgi:hypothetical protein